jgi:hypothetical protein
MDSNQLSDDLESLGLAAAAASGSDTSISLDDNNEITAADDAKKDTTTTVILTGPSHSRASKKRSAAEVSDEDEDSSLSSSPPPKAKSNRRVTRSSCATSPPIKPLEAPSAETSNSRKLLAPKPLSPPKVDTTSVSTPNPIADNGTVTVQCGRTINTSTAHVKALTGTKGAAMCFESVSGTNLDNTVAIPNLTSVDLSPEEKAQFSRDRNRLHAKNTRIRKKAYVDELKMTLDVLVKERDSAMAAKSRKAQIEMEERQVRYSVVEEFLKLRGSNEQQSPARWNAILEETVTLRLPNFDWTSKGRTSATVDGGAPPKKIVTGVTELMNECNEFSKQLKKGSKRAAVGSLVFQGDRDSLLMEGANVVMDWTASSTDESKQVSVFLWRMSIRPMAFTTNIFL